MAQRRDNEEAGKEYKPREYARGPRPDWTGPRPHVWKSGPDVLAHEQYQTWLVHKAQASFRGEVHTLTFNEYKAHWDNNDNWHLRDRKSVV